MHHLGFFEGALVTKWCQFRQLCCLGGVGQSIDFVLSLLLWVFRAESSVNFILICFIVVPSVQSMRNVTQVFKGEQGVELQCLVVEGKPRPKMMWLFRGEKLNNSLHYRLPGNGSLIILTMLPQLAGEYFCRAQNLMGNATASVHLEYAGMCEI